jgi:hypothetical protein
MYRAKHAGKARYEVFEEAMNARVLERLEMENDLRRALERREFTVPEVLEATAKFAQPELLAFNETLASNVAFGASAEPETQTIITPVPRTVT